MIALLADEDFNGDIVQGLVRRSPLLDIVRVQDVGLSRAEDATIVQWAADRGRIVLTHDVSTMTKHAHERVKLGLAMPGVFEVPQSIPIGQAIEDLLLLVACSLEGEWEGQVRYLPL